MKQAPSATQAGRPAPLLLVEDTQSLQVLYRSVLARAGHEVASATTASDALRLFAQSEMNIVLLDLVLPDRDGLSLMKDMLDLRPDTAVIVMTAHGSVGRAVEAMRAGAHEFLVKPFDEARLLSAVANVAGGPVASTPVASPHGASSPVAPAPRRAARAQTASADSPDSLTGSGFIGSSEVMERLHQKINSVARSMATVFITGESGTGKELCALAVHGASPRAAGPFIALNCGAIPQDLLESEVFGHMKGSFTGAISDKPGAAAAADGGTL
ncbi:MAG: hypothetical protein RL128_773, partial [Pseudomonadota bacterium]